MAEDRSETPREVAERAANVLAPESGMFEDLDAAGFGGALAEVLRSGAANPIAPVVQKRRQAGKMARAKSAMGIGTI